MSQGGSALCRPAVAAPGRRAAGGRSGKRRVRTRRGPGTLQPRVSCLARAGPWAEGSATAVTYSEDTGARWADLRLVTLATVGLQVAERARPEAIAASSRGSLEPPPPLSLSPVNSRQPKLLTAAPGPAHPALCTACGAVLCSAPSWSGDVSASDGAFFLTIYNHPASLSTSRIRICFLFVALSLVLGL